MNGMSNKGSNNKDITIKYMYNELYVDKTEWGSLNSDQTLITSMFSCGF